MSQSALLLLAAVLAAPVQPAESRPVEPRFTVSFDVPADAEPAQADRRSPVPPRERPHTLGLGGSVAASTSGIGGAFRYWFGEYVGVDFSAVWSRPQVGASANGTMAQVTPSVLVMLKPANVGADFDIRPFAGGGLMWAYSSYPSISARNVGGSTSGMGGQVYGGVEMIFADAPSLAISAEGVYTTVPRGLYYANTVDGFNFVLAFHYYVK